MDFDTLVWTLIGVVLGVVAQIAVDRVRKVTEDFEIWCDAWVYAHLPDPVTGEADPTRPVIEFALWSVGRRDIPSTAFDQGRPLRIDVGSPIHSRLAGEGHLVRAENLAIEVTEDGVVQVGPGLIRTGTVIHLRLVTEGVPRLSFDNPIVDLGRIRSFYDVPAHPWPRGVRRVLGWVSVVIVALISVVTGAILLNGGTGLFGVAFPFGSDVAISGAFCVIAFGILGVLLFVYRGSRGPTRAALILNRATGAELMPIESRRIVSEDRG